MTPLDPTTATAAALHAAIDDAFRTAIDLSRRAAVAVMLGNGQQYALFTELAALQRQVQEYTSELASRAGR